MFQASASQQDIRMQHREARGGIQKPSNASCRVIFFSRADCKRLDPGVSSGGNEVYR